MHMRVDPAAVTTITNPAATATPVVVVDTTGVPRAQQHTEKPLPQHHHHHHHQQPVVPIVVSTTQRQHQAQQPWPTAHLQAHQRRLATATATANAANAKAPFFLHDDRPAAQASAASVFESVFRGSAFFSSVSDAVSASTTPTTMAAATHATTAAASAAVSQIQLGQQPLSSMTTTALSHVNVLDSNEDDAAQAAIPWKTTAAAAAVESFYRSALNSKINQVLTGVKGPLLPNMHVQLPTRVLYITGFKYVRAVSDKYMNPSMYPGLETPVRLLAAVTPGIIMTPISSVLEACNANLNTEPLYRRWLNGIVARCGREIIFGIGLNQLSEYFEEKMPEHLNPALRNASGCLVAGVISGYLSHVPHNLSTMKLMNPNQGYVALLQQFSRQWYGRLGFLSQGHAREAAAVVLSLVAPQGLLVRTSQVVGSFIILNGIIHGLRHRFGEAA